MSLVDYASSDSEDERENTTIVIKHEEETTVDEKNKKTAEQSTASNRPNRNIMPPPSSYQPSPRMETKLPEASLLFSSPSFPPLNQTIMTDHSSTVAAAIAARKRESNGSTSANQRSNKVPRGTLPCSRNIPDMAGGKLIPPQLRGRSNVVTEDITKLFVRKDGQNLPKTN